MRPWIVLAGLNGAVAVAMGAYAAHGLGADPYLQGLAERASLYQLVHAAALVGADRLAADGRRGGHLAAVLMVAGMLMFSGSLYVRALTGEPLPVPMVTPAGGIAFMLGWLVLGATGMLRRTR
ncbi:DUF423 domain-containing protein [Magnetospirillum sp. UT-4]|uniref:DUF423 domain-containing protein n=1 Tax=Magnetospirillum sp. UT-4 TaxID=2681467 RepID=UPI00137CDDF5|nr:DUF423 domain-containing protein [Magnetospirillum sp. UT-4]CAA7620777.1 conserved membrane hypothetical protein [Magnetospirillum sp. UT-4]